MSHMQQKYISNSCSIYLSLEQEEIIPVLQPVSNSPWFDFVNQFKPQLNCHTQVKIPKRGIKECAGILCSGQVPKLNFTEQSMNSKDDPTGLYSDKYDPLLSSFMGELKTKRGGNVRFHRGTCQKSLLGAVKGPRFYL